MCYASSMTTATVFHLEEHSTGVRAKMRACTGSECVCMSACVVGQPGPHLAAAAGVFWASFMSARNLFALGIRNW